MIPKTIHYCWFGPNVIHPLGQRCLESWKRHMPEPAWRYVLWNEALLPKSLTLAWKFIERKEWAFAADVVRLHAIHTQGGVYLDIDAEAVRPIDPLLNNAQFLGYEREGRATDGICGGEAGASFYAEALKAMEAHYAAHTHHILAPDLCQKVLQARAFPDLKIYPPHVFYPYNPYDPAQPVKQLMAADIRKDTLLIHHWAMSWRLPLWQRARRFVKERVLKR